MFNWRRPLGEGLWGEAEGGPGSGIVCNNLRRMKDIAACNLHTRNDYGMIIQGAHAGLTKSYKVLYLFFHL